MRQEGILIDGKVVGSSRVFVIAEIGINHNGSLNQARRLIDAAAECGADAVKFQTFRADRLMIPSGDRLAQQGDDGETAFQMFRRLELSWDDHEQLKKHADEHGVAFFSTPFDEESADFLDQLGVAAFKIASADINHFPLLNHVGAKGKPVLLSTGMSYLNEVADAVWALKSAGAEDILLLHCVSAYPAPPESLNLRAIQTLRDYFDLPVGFSDHTEGILLPPIAVALGAGVIEKHFTLDKGAEGPDHKLSLNPEELRLMIRNLRDIEKSLGDGRKRPATVEEENRLLSRRSIVAAVDIRSGESISPWMLTFKRPGSGLEPRHLQKLVGMKARRNISKDTILKWEDLMPSVSPASAFENRSAGCDPSPVLQTVTGEKHHA
ncbi:MAG TPA: N-acetylneuraminate synthase [Acidobacteriota bacterium]|nr:N-acetylneuraminate synthase [Acidobacteriota bacterium]